MTDLKKWKKKRGEKKDKFKVLEKSFFKRATLIVARALLGKYLVRKIGNQRIAVKIMEVEAYDGLRDKASHAFRGKTERNAVMFGEGGHWYVYFVYGMHWMLNIVTGKAGYPAAVLIRGVEKAAGPAKLTKFLKIDKKFNGKEAALRSGLWIEDRGEIVSTCERAKRIGVDYAGPVWSKKQYRFL